MQLAARARSICAMGAAVALFLPGDAGGANQFPSPVDQANVVGRVGVNRYSLPTGQALTPTGQQVALPGMRPQAIALSPNGKVLAVAGRKRDLVLIDPANGLILQSVPLSSHVTLAITNKTDSASTNKTAVTSTNNPITAATNKTDVVSTNATIAGSITDTAAVSTNQIGSATNTTEVITKKSEKLTGNKTEPPADPRNSLIDPAAMPVESKTNAPATTNITVTAELSFTGLVFSRDGKHLYLSNAGGDVWDFAMEYNRISGEPRVLLLHDPKAVKPKREIPTGLAVSADGERLYVAGNLLNRLYEIDTRSGKLVGYWDTGVAPYDVVLVRGKAYVSNLGGRRPVKGDITAPAGSGTVVRVDPIRHIASEGSVTVVDLAADRVKTEVLVGLHASALAVSPDLRYVVVANTGRDTLNVIDTITDKVVEKIWARQTPADLFGAQPNALVFDPGGKRLYVCNGTQNAVAVVQFEPEDNASRVVGFIPVGWFPSAIQFDAKRKMLYVANLKGIGSTRVFKPDENVKLNAKDFFGTVSLISVPSELRLGVLTKAVLQNMRRPLVQKALLPPRPGEPPRPVPERSGESSVFEHVIYIIKENRTYDQVLGDMPEGNGDAGLCTFGEQFTPNQHKIALEFVLLDNTYCSGVCSADGHQWTDSAFANEYVERQISSGTPRSYTGGKGEDAVDALAWASSGFIWNNALSHGKTFRNYGEWMISTAGWSDKKKRKDKIFWSDFWKDFQSCTNLTRLRSHAGLASLRRYSDTNTVGWDLKVPDVVRADRFIQELHGFETNGGFPNLVILFLPNDHTGGSRNEYPTPGAQVADNDLALGRVVDALSHSRFWADTCVFAIEDDPQAGWDHVSGYRTTCYVASAYTRRQQTVSTPYNQISVVRTIELILGLPPMNQLDAASTPMSECFTNVPDFAPFTSLTNQIPLDEMNLEPKKIADRRLRQDAIVSARLPLNEPDRCPEDLLNRILWRSMKGPDTPYPEWAVKAADDKD